ncbi:MAG: dihydrolipoamide acetyltransferase family protein, partial [Candidatus Limnocylindrales bacterium]
PGQMTEECVLTVWRKQEGEAVHKGDVLFEIETDKAAMEVESFDEGVLLKRIVHEGETVPVNAVCAWVGAPGEAIPELAPAEFVPAEVASAPAAANGSSPEAAAPVVVAAPVPLAVHGDRLRISPRASRLAAEAGLDPRTIIGSGPGGRVLERDVVAARQAGPASPTRSTPAPALPAAVVLGEEEPRPLSRMRRVIAERLTRSFTTVPHFTVTVAVDVTRIEAERRRLKTVGAGLSVTDFVLAATAQSLVELPDVNARTDGTSVWQRRRVHLGLAVTLPTGLVVVVIRDADRLTLAELHEQAASLAAGARAGTLGPDDMTGSTFTVSNLGMFGVDEFSAIINPGESGILAVGSALPTPVAMAEGIAVRTVMKLTLSADHRMVDGELGARFLNAVRRRLEDPGSLPGAG